MSQNKARTNTANCCQGQLLEEYPLARDALPVLSSRLIHDDKMLVDTSCLALSRLSNIQVVRFVLWQVSLRSNQRAAMAAAWL